jgi:hypothetical protein
MRPMSFDRTFVSSATTAGLIGLLTWIIGCNRPASVPELDQPAWPGGDNGLRPEHPTLHLHHRASDIQTPAQWVDQAGTDTR